MAPKKSTRTRRWNRCFTTYLIPNGSANGAVISKPGSGAKAVDEIRHGITPDSYDISVEIHDCTSGRDALAVDAPARDAPGRDDQNIG